MEDTILRFSTGEWILGFLGLYLVAVVALGFHHP
jgi:hypothetical protein